MFINSFDEEEEKPGFTTPCEDIGLDDASLRAYLHKHREDILRCKDICLYLGYTADKTGEFDPVEREFEPETIALLHELGIKLALSYYSGKWRA